MNPYVGACGSGSGCAGGRVYPYPVQVGQMGPFGPGIPAGMPGDPCPGSRQATPAEIMAGMVDAGGRCYLPPPAQMIPELPPPVSYYPPPGYGGPCGPMVFPQGYVAQQGMAGASARLAPQMPIGLQCDDPLLPGHVAFGATAATDGDSCDACCTSQGCFCVTDIVIGNCGECALLISSIKSGLCELIQCGDILADTFFCNCAHPPLRTSMLMPGIEFCISVRNILQVGSGTAAPTPAEIAAGTRRFFATVWGLPGDNNCQPCLGPDPRVPPPGYVPPGYVPPGYVPPQRGNPGGFLPGGGPQRGNPGGFLPFPGGPGIS